MGIFQSKKSNYIKEAKISSYKHKRVEELKQQQEKFDILLNFVGEKVRQKNTLDKISSVPAGSYDLLNNFSPVTEKSIKSINTPPNTVASSCDYKTKRKTNKKKKTNTKTKAKTKK